MLPLIWHITAAQIKTGPSNDGMNMRMKVELLAPCMENLDNPGNSTEKFFVSSKLENRFCGAFVDKIVEQSLIGIEQGIQFGRNGKDKMVIGTVYDFRRSLVHPPFFWNSLAVRAIPVAAGIEMRNGFTAVWADLRVKAKRTGFAVHNSPGGFSLLRGKRPCPFNLRKGDLKDFLNLRHVRS